MALKSIKVFLTLDEYTQLLLKAEERLLKDVELMLVAELMKNNRRSGRELAKALGVSQPTVSRKIKLEKEAIIKECTIIPEWHKLGYEIFALTFSSLKQDATREQIEQMRRMGREMIQRVAFESVMVIRIVGMGHQLVIASFHKNCSGFVEFKRMISSYPFVDASNIESFLVTLPDWQYKSLTLSTPAKHLLKMKENEE
jgi:DNA-binding Lrp family transcriptional regulator